MVVRARSNAPARSVALQFLAEFDSRHLHQRCRRPRLRASAFCLERRESPIRDFDQRASSLVRRRTLRARPKVERSAAMQANPRALHKSGDSEAAGISRDVAAVTRADWLIQRRKPSTEAAPQIIRPSKAGDYSQAFSSHFKKIDRPVFSG